MPQVVSSDNADLKTDNYVTDDDGSDGRNVVKNGLVENSSRFSFFNYSYINIT